MEKRKGSYKGLDYYYYGSSLEEERRNIIFYFGSRIDLRYYPSVIKSAVEAVSHGYDIITNGRYRARRALSIPVLSYSGRLFVVISPSLDSFSYTSQEKLVLLTGGGFISFSDDEEDGMDLFLTSSEKLLTLSDKIIFIGKAVPRLASLALDRGMDVAVLRDFLYERETRELAMEGAAVIDTFSSWLEWPEHIAYEEVKEDKRYLRLMSYQDCAIIKACRK